MRFFSSFALSLVISLVAISAAAQTYPSRPVRLIVTFTPGGGADTTARVFADRLSDMWKQQVLVENRPGAGGSIGAEIVHKSPPDGYTLFLSTNTHIINQVVYPNLTFDFTKDFAPIANVTNGPMVLAVNSAKIAAKDLKEFTAMLKSAPGKYSYASCNVASPHHFAMEMYKSALRIFAVHIPHRGCGPAAADTAAGHMEIVVATLPATAAFVKQGRLRPIAVLSAQRSPAAPDIPTVRESGIPELKDFSLETYYGFMAPPGTPAALTSKIEADVLAIAKQPEVRKRLEGAGMDMLVLNGMDMMALIRADYAKYRQAAQGAGIKAE
jgi:tripartite-type tricarboxylate transporter receptor subunit TctC